MAILILASISLVAGVFAQDRRKPGQPGNASYTNPQLALDVLDTGMSQKEIGVTAEQHDRLALARRALREQLVGRFDKLPPDQRQQREFETQVDSALQSASEQITSVLTPNQLARLNEISNQVCRANLFLCRDVLDTLNATEEQVNRIDTILQNRTKSIDALQAATGINVPHVVTNDYVAKRLEVFDIEDAINKMVFQEITMVFTNAQRERLCAMLGKPIDIHRLGRELLLASMKNGIEE
jgi:hypothetical protein